MEIPQRASFAHVDHIMVADFDIDKGASLTHQYPTKTGTHENILAELMLPDGAHLRDEDWTMFFINQPTPSDSDQKYRPLVAKNSSLSVRPTIGVHAYRWNPANREWVPITPSGLTVVRLEHKRLGLWVEGCSQKLAEITDVYTEYQLVEPLCVCVFSEKTIYGFRFENEDDEILMLNHIDEHISTTGRYAPEEDLPPPPPSGKQGKPLMYVLNLVRTKHIAGARRGAQIKAMAVASRHQWVHVFKPLLIMALEAFFNSPTEDIIAELFTSINNMDLSPMPRLSLIERMIIRNSEDRTLFEEKFNEAEERTRTLSLPRSQRSDRADKKPEGGDFILNRMKSIKKKNPGSHSLQANIGTIERTKQKSKFNKDLLYFEARVDFHGVRVPIRVPLAALPEEIGDFSTAKFVSTLLASGIMIPPVNDQTQYQNGVPYYWHPHLDCGSATHGLIVLLNALLTEKRVLFMGYQRPAGDVANYVLAACALISGGGSLLKGISGRCFPYIGLAGLDTLLSVPGYIAGVTNPMFEEQTGWWDVLCDINTGKIKVSPKLEILSGEREPPTLPKDVEWFKAGAWEGDADFIKEISNLIQSHMGEMYIRQRFYDRIRRILDVAATVERDLSEDGTTEIGLNKRDLRGSTATEGLSVGFGTYFVDDYAKKREVMMLKNTIEGWRKTTSYQRFKKSFQTDLLRRNIHGIDPRFVISCLKIGRGLTEAQAVKIFVALQDEICAGSDAAVLELLALLPQAMGGLYPIATGLFHPRWEVRRSTVKIFGRLEWHANGSKFIQQLNPFIYLAYKRTAREIAIAEPEHFETDSNESLSLEEDAPVETTSFQATQATQATQAPVTVQPSRLTASHSGSNLQANVTQSQPGSLAVPLQINRISAARISRASGMSSRMRQTVSMLIEGEHAQELQKVLQASISTTKIEPTSQRTSVVAARSETGPQVEPEFVPPPVPDQGEAYPGYQAPAQPATAYYLEGEGQLSWQNSIKAGAAIKSSLHSPVSAGSGDDIKGANGALPDYVVAAMSVNATGPAQHSPAPLMSTPGHQSPQLQLSSIRPAPRPGQAESKDAKGKPKWFSWKRKDKGSDQGSNASLNNPPADSAQSEQMSEVVKKILQAQQERQDALKTKLENLNQRDRESPRIQMVTMEPQAWHSPSIAAAHLPSEYAEPKQLDSDHDDSALAFAKPVFASSSSSTSLHSLGGHGASKLDDDSLSRANRSRSNSVQSGRSINTQNSYTAPAGPVPPVPSLPTVTPKKLSVAVKQTVTPMSMRTPTQTQRVIQRSASDTTFSFSKDKLGGDMTFAEVQAKTMAESGEHAYVPTPPPLSSGMHDPSFESLSRRTGVGNASVLKSERPVSKAAKVVTPITIRRSQSQSSTGAPTPKLSTTPGPGRAPESRPSPVLIKTNFAPPVMRQLSIKQVETPISQTTHSPLTTTPINKYPTPGSERGESIEAFIDHAFELGPPSAHVEPTRPGPAVEIPHSSEASYGQPLTRKNTATAATTHAGPAPRAAPQTAVVSAQPGMVKRSLSVSSATATIKTITPVKLSSSTHVAKPHTIVHHQHPNQYGPVDGTAAGQPAGERIVITKGSTAPRAVGMQRSNSGSFRDPKSS